MYTFGLALFAFGIFFDFWLVKKTFDAEERQALETKPAAETKAAGD
jgi:hypothetical protein